MKKLFLTVCAAAFLFVAANAQDPKTGSCDKAKTECCKNKEGKDKKECGKKDGDKKECCKKDGDKKECCKKASEKKCDEKK